MDTPATEKTSAKILGSTQKNVVADLINNELTGEKTVHQTSVDPASQYNPWNSDELYQKRGNYSIYEDMLKDDQVSVAMAVKKDLIIGSGWHITCESEEDSDIRKDLEIALTEDIEASFEDCLAEIITAYDVGFSVSEKQFKTRDDGSLTVKNIKTRNPVSWLFHQDKFGNVKKYEQQGAEKEFSDIDPNSIIHFVNNPRYGNPYGTSDLRAAYTAYFIKKQIIRFYAIFLEKAASPLPVAKYDRGVGLDGEIQTVHDTLKKLQTSTALTIPKDFEVSFIEAKGNGESYTKGINMFNMFIGRALFVPDLLGFQGGETSGGSQALGREQMVVFFKHINRRRRTLENLINHHIIKPLVIWNWGYVEQYPKFKLNPIEEDVAERNAKLWLELVKTNQAPPTQEEINHFKRIVQFPESEDEGDEEDPIEAAAKDAKVEGEQEGDQKPADEKFAAKVYNLPKGDYCKKTNFKAIEKQLDSGLDILSAKARPIIKDIVSKYADKVSKFNTGKAVKLEQLEKLTLPRAQTKLLEKLLDDSLTQAYNDAMDTANQEIFKSNFRAQASEEFLKTLEEENYNFIGDWEYALTKRVRTEIIAAVKDGRPIASVINILTDDVLAESTVSVDRYARTKFTEVMNKGRLESFNKTGVVGAYQYAAVLDNQTSEICAGLHGKVFKAGTEPIPPMHFNCRSLLVPITNYEEWEPDSKVGKQNINDFIEENKGTGFSTF